ncbi:MAG: sigma-70 family RNA polymerase sigma factor [Pseudomonadota bacterium]
MRRKGQQYEASDSQADIARLTQELRRHCPVAWATAHTLYNARMVQRAKQVLRNPDDAADVVHDAWLILLGKIESKPDDPSKLGAYVLQIVGYKALELNRRAMRRCTHTGDEQAIASFPCEDSDPEDHAIAQQAVAELEGQLRRLKCERDRDILRALLIESEDRDAVRSRYGLSRDQFSKVLSRSRHRLRSLCGAQGASASHGRGSQNSIDG